MVIDAPSLRKDRVPMASIGGCLWAGARSGARDTPFSGGRPGSAADEAEPAQSPDVLCKPLRVLARERCSARVTFAGDTRAQRFAAPGYAGGPTDAHARGCPREPCSVE